MSSYMYMYQFFRVSYEVDPLWVMFDTVVVHRSYESQLYILCIED